MVETLDLERMQGRLVIDTSEGLPAYLLIGENNSYIKLSSNAYHLLCSIHAGLSFDELAGYLSQRQQRQVSAAEVETAYRQVVDKIKQIEQQASPQHPGFWLRIPCLPQTLVRPLARCLALAFHPFLVVALLALIAVGLWAFFRHQALFFSFNHTSLWASYGLYLLSMIVHELGHASACARYEAEPGSIGFGVYWLYPVFYSDVSAAWQLKRWQRVVVDLGGSYFQLVVGACYAIALVFSGWEPLGIAFMMILSTTLFSLNPVMKFDGYWVIADALGVTNLAQQPARIAGYLRERLLRCPTRPLPWPTSIVAVLIAYTVLSFAFWGYFTWMILTYVWHQAYDYPFLVSILVNDLLYEPRQLLSGHLQSFLTATFMLLIAWLMLVRILRFVLGPLKALVGRAAQLTHRAPQPILSRNSDEL